MARSTRDGEPRDGESGPMGVAPGPTPKIVKRVGIQLEDNGAIRGVSEYHKNVMGFQPPRTIEMDRLARAVNDLREALTEGSG